jgi:TRAP-type C4-dicarboxylate transport system permease small subunit
MGTARRVAAFYISATEALGIFVIAAISVVAILQVFFRYVVGASLFWSEELMRYMMAWSAFLLAGLAYSRGEMLGLTLVVDALPRRLQLIATALVRLAIIGFLLVVAWYGYDFAWRTRFDYAIALRVPMLWIHMCVPVGCVLMAIHVFASFFVDHGEPPHEGTNEGMI